MKTPDMIRIITHEMQDTTTKILSSYLRIFFFLHSHPIDTEPHLITSLTHSKVLEDEQVLFDNYLNE